MSGFEPIPADVLEERANALQERVNAEIAKRCKGESYLRFETIVEMVTGEMINRDEWEFRGMNRFNGVPRIAITRYLK